MVWIPTQNDIPGNKQANQLAKKATVTADISMVIPEWTSCTTELNKYLASTLATNMEFWRSWIIKALRFFTSQHIPYYMV